MQAQINCLIEVHSIRIEPGPRLTGSTCIVECAVFPFNKKTPHTSSKLVLNFGLPPEASQLIGKALQEQIGLTLKHAEADSEILPEEEEAS